MRDLLIRILLWCLRKLHVVMLPVPLDVREIMPRVVSVVIEQEKLYPNQSGEYKRYNAYGKLTKLYPKLRKRTIGLAIEYAIHELNI